MSSSCAATLRCEYTLAFLCPSPLAHPARWAAVPRFVTGLMRTAREWPCVSLQRWTSSHLGWNDFMGGASIWGNTPKNAKRQPSSKWCVKNTHISPTKVHQKIHVFRHPSLWKVGAMAEDSLKKLWDLQGVLSLQGSQWKGQCHLHALLAAYCLSDQSISHFRAELSLSSRR